MIPLKGVHVLYCDRTAALLVPALTHTTCELGCDVELPVPCCVPLLQLRGFVLTRMLAFCFPVTRLTQRHEADGAVLSGASLHLCLECSWSHPTRRADLHSEQSGN